MTSRKSPYLRAHGARDDAQTLAIDTARRIGKLPSIDEVLVDTEAAVIGSPAPIPHSGLTFVAGVARAIPHGLGRTALGFIEVYSVSVPSAGHVGLYPVAFTDGKTARTHLSLMPTASGTCFLRVY